MIKKYKSKTKTIILIFIFVALFIFLPLISINTSATSVSNTKREDKPVILTDIILYKDALYKKAEFYKNRAENFFRNLKIFRRDFKYSNIYFIPAPLSQLMIEDADDIDFPLASQSQIIKEFKKINKNSDIQILDICDRMLRHKDEYLYLKYDHHWSSRGAYYAYEEFCKVRNEYCETLDYYREVLLNEEYRGLAWETIASYKEKIKDKSDKLYAYIPDIESKLYIMNESGLTIKELDVIDEKQKTYWGAFINGDHPYSKIEAKNNKNKTALVLKDSYGCAFIPYLVSSYSEIYIVDPRFASFKVYDKIKNVKLDDIIVIGSVYTPSTEVFIEGIKKITK